MDIALLYKYFSESSGVCTDTRKMHDNCIFIALRGENFNGNAYAPQALEKGARLAVVDDSSLQGPSYFFVEDTLRALQELASFHRRELNAKVIAITGSNGKTTTKELLAGVLSTTFKIVATPGNFNNHIGLPLTILSAPTGTEILLLEMGDNQPGDINELCEISDPDVGYITNIGKDHLAGYENGFEGNVASKAELFDYLRNHNRPVFVDRRDPLLMKLTQGMQQILFGEQDESNQPEFQESVFVTYRNSEGELKPTNLIGAYNLRNIEAVYAIARYFKVEVNKIDRAITAYTPENNRSQLLKTESNTLLMDAYNANPSSVSEALESFAKVSGDKVALLGDMLELGTESTKEHQEMIDLAHKLNISCLFIGEEYTKCEPTGHAKIFSCKKDAEQYLIDNPYRNTTILLKGSRGMAMETFKAFL
jgi:UDP-N-acetylmuramoyl-tripeptide--D-alanyl-D-alanine ligase